MQEEQFQFYDEKTGKMGLKDLHGKVIIQARFDMIQPISEGLGLFSIENKYGYVDINDKIVIPATDTYKGDFSEGLACIYIEEKYGFINKKGDLIIKPQWEWVDKFQEGLCVVRDGNDHGYINKQGDLVINCRYQYACPFSEGLARVQLKDKWGFINKDGKILLEPIYYFVDDFKDGKAIIQRELENGDIQEGKMDVSGKIEWNNNLDGLNEANRKARELHKALQNLIEYYCTNGCPCQYPRYREIVAFKHENYNAIAVRSEETEYLNSLSYYGDAAFLEEVHLEEKTETFDEVRLFKC